MSAIIVGAGPQVNTHFHDDADYVVKAKPGQVLGFYATNENAAVRYLQIHDKATAPAGSDVPVFSFRIAATSDLRVGAEFFTEMGVAFANGISIGVSTVKGSFTAATASEHMVMTLFA